MPLDLAQSAESVKRNIDAYWLDGPIMPELIKDGPKAKQWKCYMTSDGYWRCGPSRFVGYEGMTPEEYLRRKGRADGGLNGTETEYHLRSWTEDVAPGSRRHDALYDIVSTHLEGFGVSVNRAARFSILPSEMEAEEREEDPDMAAVNALVTLAERLDAQHRRSLIRRLDALDRQL
ncbi:hypothetical protein [Roseisalinus antarcticus]|uniref:Uncharacterized protein n=1 Tax=Roseisalinus antarcticus TaxID=254357 RepID=A0A1Y5U177_9RHOB|nr:hypothetical protein [Roseisalinus antarcticus]SLN78077.1 hypothetical protein ROA7023_04731 [Roseisalinus antarcticus]